MTSFRPKKSQAKHLVLKKTHLGASRHALKAIGLNDDEMPIVSIGTRDRYTVSIGIFLDHLHERKISPRDVNIDIAHDFLKIRAADSKQKTINADRQALQKVFAIDLPYVLSDIETFKNQRAYSAEQISYLIDYAPSALRISIQLAHIAGLRTIELDTIARVNEMRENDRSWLTERFVGRENYVRYVVHGKGGLRRKVAINQALSDELEQYRLEFRTIKKSRGIEYTKYYSIPGGHSFSQKFTRFIKKHFGWSHGAHGLRHSFAQERMHFLQCHGFTFDYALQIVGQELGHFNTKNTREYLR